MKTVCYLILAHRDLLIVRRTIDLLAGPSACFAVHIDAKCREDLPVDGRRDDIYVCRRRHDVVWGEISLVDATLTLCREAVARFDAAHYVLISGNDYPLKSRDHIEALLSDNVGRNFVAGRRLPSSQLPWLEGGARRLNAYALSLSARRIATIEPHALNLGNLRQLAKVIIFAPKKLGKACALLLHGKRRTAPCPIYGGSTWWIIAGDTLRQIIDYDSSHPEFHAFMADTNNPDEVYFQTLVYNLAPDVTANRLLRQISWDKHGNSPRWLTTADSEEISRGVNDPEALFLRKVGDEAVADLIDSLKG